MPSLEELVSADETASEIERASEIAREEWEKIRVSLALCGDTGDFCGDDFMLGTISGETITREPLESPTKSVSVYSPTYYPMYFVKNLREFREKFGEKLPHNRSPLCLCRACERGSAEARPRGNAGYGVCQRLRERENGLDCGEGTSGGKCRILRNVFFRQAEELRLGFSLDLEGKNSGKSTENSSLGSAPPPFTESKSKR